MNLFSRKPDPVLLARIEQLESELARTGREMEKQQQRNKLLTMRLSRFKAFSPKLWFEYFSHESGKLSNSGQAGIEFRKWLANEQKQGKHQRFNMGDLRVE